MQLAVIGLRRMGSNMVRHLLQGGHHTVAFGKSRQARDAPVGKGAVVARALDELVAKLNPSRALWSMVPAAFFDSTLAELAPKLSSNNTVIDESVPGPVLTAALLQRFASCAEDDYANRILSAMRSAFGGHVEKSK